MFDRGTSQPRSYYGLHSCATQGRALQTRQAVSATEWPVVQWCYQVIWSQTCCNLPAPESSSVPKTIAHSEIWLSWTLESLYLRAHPKRRARACWITRTGRNGQSFWAREIDVPSRRCQSGSSGNGASSSRREPVCFCPLPRLLFPLGVFPDLKQSNVVSRYACGSRWGLA